MIIQKECSQILSIKIVSIITLNLYFVLFAFYIIDNLSKIHSNQHKKQGYKIDLEFLSMFSFLK